MPRHMQSYVQVWYIVLEGNLFEGAYIFHIGLCDVIRVVLGIIKDVVERCGWWGFHFQVSIQRRSSSVLWGIPSWRVRLWYGCFWQQQVSKSQLVNWWSVRRHAHHLVPHVDCVVQFKYQPQETSTVEWECSWCNILWSLPYKRRIEWSRTSPSHSSFFVELEIRIKNEIVSFIKNNSKKI